MVDLYEVLINIRKSFSYLWDEYEFKFTSLIPRDGYHDYGYFAQLQNKWACLAFQAESGSFDSLTIMPIGTSFAESVDHWALLSTREEWKRDYAEETLERFFNSYADFARPYVIEMLELAKTPDLFKRRIEELEAADHTGQVTIEMIRAERARLHSLGQDSSLGAALANLRKGGNA